MSSEDIDALVEDPNWFPFVETWSKKTAEQMFDTLSKSPYGGGIDEIPKALSQFSQADFKFSIPARFRRPVPQLRTAEGGYVFLTHDVGNKDLIEMNAVGDFYMEDLRLSSSKRRFMEKTPIEMWDKDKRRIVQIAREKNGGRAGPYEIRNAIFAFTKESNPFRPSIALGIYSLFNARSILDMSSGWGDRLLGAMAWARRDHNIIRYQGYDPFLDLQPRYAEMIRDFGTEGSRLAVTPTPFEEAPDEERAFDLAFTSPPYFDFEEYGISWKSGDPADRSGQSTVRYPQVQDWVNSFLKPMMEKAARSLRVRGHLAINIEGTFMYELLNDSSSLFADRLGPRMEYLGIIGYQSNVPRDHIIHPTFVWRRLS